MFDPPTAYVRFRRNWLSVRRLRPSGEAGSFESPAAIVVISDIDQTAAGVRAFLHKANGERRLRRRVPMVIHSLDPLDGGLTDVEHRALIELGVTVGGQLNCVSVCDAQNDLSDSEIRERRHP